MHAVRAALQGHADLQGVQALLDALKDVERTDVHIISVGGVGSTELSNFLNRHDITTNLLRDNDNTRHVCRPPDFGTDLPRTVVYLYGDPLASIASHYRRGHAYHQALKTSGGALIPAKTHATFPPTLEAYVRGGQDLFGYHNHWQLWRAGASDYDVLFVRYERMFDPEVSRDLMRRLCSHKMDEAAVERMADEFTASKKQRSSQVPAELYGLMYQDLLADVDSLPPLTVVPARGRQ